MSDGEQGRQLARIQLAGHRMPQRQHQGSAGLVQEWALTSAECVSTTQFRPWKERRRLQRPGQVREGFATALPFAAPSATYGVRPPSLPDKEATLEAYRALANGGVFIFDDSQAGRKRGRENSTTACSSYRVDALEKTPRPGGAVHASYSHLANVTRGETR